VDRYRLALQAIDEMQYRAMNDGVPVEPDLATSTLSRSISRSLDANIVEDG